MHSNFYSVKEFCLSHKIGRDLFYRLCKAGVGPRITKLGFRTLIATNDADEWREKIKDIDTASALRKLKEDEAKQKAGEAA